MWTIHSCVGLFLFIVPEAARRQHNATLLRPSTMASSSSSVFPLKFTYVKIPADTSQPLGELVGVARSAGDSPATYIEHFAGGSVTNDAGLRAEFGDEVLNQKRGALNRVAARGSVETFALCRPSASTLPLPYAGVYLYLDEMGVLKDLPLNTRAGEIARACGLDVESPFLGDVYLARVQVEPAPTRNTDFTLRDLAPGSDFFRSAPGENAAYDAAMREYNQAVKEKEVAGGPTTHLGAPASSSADLARGWWYTQTADEVELSVALPDAPLRARDLAVEIKPSSVRVALKGSVGVPLAEFDLFGSVRPDESTWVIGQGPGGKPCVVATMEKVSAQTWPQLESKGKETVV